MEDRDRGVERAEAGRLMQNAFAGVAKDEDAIAKERHSDAAAGGDEIRQAGGGNLQEAEARHQDAVVDRGRRKAVEPVAQDFRGAATGDESVSHRRQGPPRSTLHDRPP